MDNQTIIGPYLEIIGKLTTTEIKIKRECPKHRQRFQADNKFCGICSLEIESVEIPITKKVDPWEVLGYENFDDGLFSPEGLSSIMIPNDTPLPKIKWDSEESGTLNLSSIEMDEKSAKQVEWFNKKFKKEITLLSEKFGYTNVHVRWGLVSYWS